MTFPFYNTFRAELVKCKNSQALWLTVLGAAFIPAINFLKCVLKPDYFVDKVKTNPWQVWLEYNWQIAASLMMVTYIILVTSLIVQIEVRNHAWKQTLVIPRSYTEILLAKFAVVHFLIIGCILFFNVFIVACAYLTCIIQPKYPFLSNTIPFGDMARTSIKMYGSILAVTAIQYFLSIHLKNFATAIGIGIVLFIGGFMIRQWEYIDLYPHIYPLLVYFPNPGIASGTLSRVLVSSAVWCVAVTVIGLVIFSLKREKS
ncbi:MAG TPA: ABC transporter permease [Cyclobacteriaceae bacterium]|jgi:hypothetical protein|nr:ABC transporter permease [Cyclobacteriaceae bacterium]